MTDGDVETIDKRGQWVTRVIGDPERSSSYSSKEEAVEAGRLLADHLGTAHIVHDAAPTGRITDPVSDADPTGATTDPADA
ncbi:MAG: hypothetical protein JWQ68_465 [Cryobacterium sp.]|jgi:hypothetical protein|nr:hypothetical protein [Cryobacterium sp.]